MNVDLETTNRRIFLFLYMGLPDQLLMLFWKTNSLLSLAPEILSCFCFFPSWYIAELAFKVKIDSTEFRNGSEKRWNQRSIWDLLGFHQKQELFPHKLNQFQHFTCFTRLINCWRERISSIEHWFSSICIFIIIFIAATNQKCASGKWHTNNKSLLSWCFNAVDLWAYHRYLSRQTDQIDE